MKNNRSNRWPKKGDCVELTRGRVYTIKEVEPFPTSYISECGVRFYPTEIIGGFCIF